MKVAYIYSAHNHFFPIEALEFFFFFIFNFEENYDFVGKLPDVNDYFLFGDTSLQIEEKKCFYEQLPKNGNWSFKDNLLKSTDQDAIIVLKTCTSFLNDCLSFQENIKSFFKLQDKKIIHPFEKRIISISGYSYIVCNYFFLNEYNFFAVNFEYTGNFVNTSRGELEFVTYKEFSEPEKEWIHHYNSISGQKTFKNYKVDLWSPDKTIHEYYGCEFHYHLPPDCEQNRTKTETSLNCNKKTYLELKEKDTKIRNDLLTNFSDEVLSHEIMFECKWKREKLSQRYLDFKKKFEHFLQRPLHRLTPRTSVRSGISDVYYLFWEKESFPNERFLYSDLQGLYSQAAIEYEFPIGPYETIVGIDIHSKITFNEEEGFHYYEDKKLVCGSAFIKIRAPEGLKRPFLQYRVNDQFNFLALCKECCITKSKKCGHSKTNFFESTWMLSDINKAVQLGYKILAWYEIHYFPQTAPILKEYSKILYSEKIKNSGFPTNVITLDDKIKYCNTINNKMNLSDNFRLTPNNVTDNPALRQLAKSQLNNVYGKFSQNSNQTETLFVRNQFCLEEIFKTKKVTEISNVLDNIVQLEVQHINWKSKPKSNIYIGAQIRYNISKRFQILCNFK